MAERDSNMPSVPTYAGTVAPYALSKDPSSDGATVLSVTPDSPAYDIGLEPGMRVLTVNGKPLTDMIVWLWETEDVEAEIEVFDPRDNTVASAVIERFPGEEWGVDFDGVVFDGMRTRAHGEWQAAHRYDRVALGDRGRRGRDRGIRPA